MKQVLTSIVGNASLKRKLYSDILSSSLSHAYIIEGKKGSGKHTLAYLLAASVSCENSKNEGHPTPCLTCSTCRRILEGNSPDVILVSKEKDKVFLSVDIIRELREDVNLVANELDTKIYVIEDAGLMTTEAQNALLLTLEEPPAFVKFFLLCENSESLLETIKSRCQKVSTEPIDISDIDTFLQKNNTDAKRLKLSSPESYNELLMASEGTIGKAIELLDENKLKQTLAARALARDFLGAISKKCSSELFASIIGRFDKKRDVIQTQFYTIETALRDVIAIQRTEDAPLLFFHSRDEALSFADTVNTRKLMSVYSALKEAQDSISQNANMRLSLISFFANINII